MHWMPAADPCAQLTQYSSPLASWPVPALGIMAVVGHHQQVQIYAIQDHLDCDATLAGLDLCIRQQHVMT